MKICVCGVFLLLVYICLTAGDEDIMGEWLEPLNWFNIFMHLLKTHTSQSTDKYVIGFKELVIHVHVLLNRVDISYSMQDGILCYRFL